MVRRMPPGLRWCVDEETIYVRMDPESRSSQDITDAMAGLDGFRPNLVAITGGRRTAHPRLPATGLG